MHVVKKARALTVAVVLPNEIAPAHVLEMIDDSSRRQQEPVSMLTPTAAEVAVLPGCRWENLLEPADPPNALAGRS